LEQILERETSQLNEYEDRRTFDSLASWYAYLSSNPDVQSVDSIDSFVAYALENGISSRALGTVRSSDISVSGKNYRETFLAAGFNPRQRMMLELALESLEGKDVNSVCIFAHEALTNFALFLRGRFPRFIGSEYARTAKEKALLFPIQSIDIQESAFPDNSFDLILSGDVLEHVPNLEASIKDCHRILKPGGRFLATFPFNYGGEETVVKAALVDGKIVNHAIREYHGNR